jgi:hypothetical protein
MYSSGDEYTPQFVSSTESTESAWEESDWENLIRYFNPRRRLNFQEECALRECEDDPTVLGDPVPFTQEDEYGESSYPYGEDEDYDYYGDEYDYDLKDFIEEFFGSSDSPAWESLFP